LYVFLFGIYGIDYNVSLAVAIIERVMSTIVSSSGGVVYLFNNFRKISNVS